jgi:hypothetical protein
VTEPSESCGMISSVLPKDNLSNGRRQSYNHELTPLKTFQYDSSLLTCFCEQVYFHPRTITKTHIVNKKIVSKSKEHLILISTTNRNLGSELRI